MVEQSIKFGISGLSESELVAAHNAAVSQALEQGDNFNDSIKAVSEINCKEIIDAQKGFKRDIEDSNIVTLHVLNGRINENKKNIVQIKNSVDNLTVTIDGVKKDHESLTERHNNYIFKESERRKKKEILEEKRHLELISKIEGVKVELISKIEGVKVELISRIEGVDTEMQAMEKRIMDMLGNWGDVE